MGISPDVVFILLAGIVLLGFILDALFDRLRVANILPLMLVGIALVQFRVVSGSDLSVIDGLSPYVSDLTIAFILFAVGLEIRAGELARLAARANAFVFSVQVTSGLLISLLAYATFHWGLLLSFVFGFALSGTTTAAAPTLVRITRLGRELGTVLVYESVISDLLQLLVPVILLGIYQTGSFSSSDLALLVGKQVLGSAAAGVAAGILWLWLLDYFRDAARGYTWTLTITLVLATYGLTDFVGLSAPITIFIFGLVLGNSLLLDRLRPPPKWQDETRTNTLLHRVRVFLRLRTSTLDIRHIERVQREVTFFASAFFFVYLGLLFEAPSISALLLIVTAVAAVVMLAPRVLFVPILAPYFSTTAALARRERRIVVFDVSRGLAPAIVATLLLSYNVPRPVDAVFLDAIFFTILFSLVISTIGIFIAYTPGVPPRPSDDDPFPYLPETSELSESGPPAPVLPPAPDDAPAPAPTARPPLPSDRPR
ncbi:MAG TPA: cation:proton antiporter [Thermoplasmata archaeon]|nr:cation:proton antiporter [Thermoplasmata archaeon]